ncbi:MAG: sulfotransferase [Halioglobus sp.]
MKDFFNIFQSIQILHLTESKERAENVRTLKRVIGTNTALKIENAVTPDKDEFLELIKTLHIKSFPTCFRCKALRCTSTDCNNILIKSQIACVLTHYNALRSIVEAETDCNLIVEDDAVIHDFIQQRQNSLRASQLARGLLDREEPTILKLGWALDSRHSYTDVFELEKDDSNTMSNPAYAVNLGAAKLLVEKIEKEVSHTADVMIHGDQRDGIDRMISSPPIFSEKSWSTGELESSIHPKASYLQVLREKLENAEPQEELTLLKKINRFENVLSRHVRHCSYHESLIVNQALGVLIAYDGDLITEFSDLGYSGASLLYDPLLQAFAGEPKYIFAKNVEFFLPKHKVTREKILQDMLEGIAFYDALSEEYGVGSLLQIKNIRELELYLQQRCSQVNTNFSIDLHSQVMQQLLTDRKNNPSKDFSQIEQEYCDRKLVPYNFYRFCRELQNPSQKNRNETQSQKFFSIVTINLNNALGLRDTLLSVFNQTIREEIEIIVVDGQSNDESIRLLKQVAPLLDVCVSGKDEGIYHAMNRGVSMANARYTIFMNSGDTFAELDVLQKIKPAISKSGADQPDLLYGAAKLGTGHQWDPRPLETMWKCMPFSHQALFAKTSLLKSHALDTKYKIAADFDFIYRMYTEGKSFLNLGVLIANCAPGGVSDDFKTRTIERWQIVRSHCADKKELDSIDSFYSAFTQTSGSIAPLNFNSCSSIGTTGGDVSQSVIFLFSLPRSGSTMLQHLLGSAPEIGTLGEPWFLLPLLGGTDPSLVSAKYDTALAEDAMGEFRKSVVNKAVFEDAKVAYMDTVYREALTATGTMFFLDKTPRYIYVIDEIIRLYPEAKFIFLARNPASIISSYATTWCNGSFKTLLKSEEMMFDITNGLARLAKAIISHKRNATLVQYENLVSHPETEMKRIFNFLGVATPINPSEYNKSETAKTFTFGDHKNVYNYSSPNKQVATKWITDLQSSDTLDDFYEIIDGIDESIFDALGYNRGSTLLSIREDQI